MDLTVIHYDDRVWFGVGPHVVKESRDEVPEGI